MAVGSIHDTSAAVVPGSALSTKFPGQPWTTGRDVSDAAVIGAVGKVKHADYKAIPCKIYLDLVHKNINISKQHIMQNIYTLCI